MKSIRTLSTIVFLVLLTQAMATSYGPPQNRKVKSPNGQYVLDINAKSGRHEIRKGKKVLWSFERRIWHDEFYLSNDGQRVLWVAWRQVQVNDDGKGWINRQADEALQEEAVVVYSPDGVVWKKTFADVSTPEKPEGPGPIGDFWRVWRGTEITQEGDLISIPVNGKKEDLKIDLSKIKKQQAEQPAPQVQSEGAPSD